MQNIHRHTILGISFFAPIWISVKDDPRHFKLVYNNNPNWEKKSINIITVQIQVASMRMFAFYNTAGDNGRCNIIYEELFSGQLHQGLTLLNCLKIEVQIHLYSEMLKTI